MLLSIAEKVSMSVPSASKMNKRTVLRYMRSSEFIHRLRFLAGNQPCKHAPPVHFVLWHHSQYHRLNSASMISSQ